MFFFPPISSERTSRLGNRILLLRYRHFVCVFVSTDRFLAVSIVSTNETTTRAGLWLPTRTSYWEYDRISLFSVNVSYLPGSKSFSTVAHNLFHICSNEQRQATHIGFSKKNIGYCWLLSEKERRRVFILHKNLQPQVTHITFPRNITGEWWQQKECQWTVTG